MSLFIINLYYVCVCVCVCLFVTSLYYYCVIITFCYNTSGSIKKIVNSVIVKCIIFV